MNDCKEVFAKLSEYLNAELEPGDCDDLERHVADCPPCIEFIDSLRKSVALCREFKPPEAPAPLPDDVREKLRAAYERTLAKRRSE
jgi:anti-sigma factor (TIGR02949 family)